MSDTTTKRATKKSRPETVRDHWMGKSIRYTLACFNESSGSWGNEDNAPRDAEDHDVLATVFKVTKVEEIGTASKVMHVEDVHFMENIRLTVIPEIGPFVGHGCTYVAYGWEAVIVP